MGCRRWKRELRRSRRSCSTMIDADERHWSRTSAGSRFGGDFTPPAMASIRRGRRHRLEIEREGRTLYRSRRGMIFGVCQGVADYYDLPVFWVRVGMVIASTFTGFWPAIGLYILAAIIIKMEPVLPLETEEDQEFYHSYTASRSMALHRLKRTFDNLDRRIQRLENAVTTREYDWERRLNS